MTTVSLPESLISTLPGSYYTDATIFAMEQAEIFESMWFCAVRAADLDKPGCLQDRSGRTRERADHAVPQRRDARVLQRLPASRRAAVHRGERRGQARVPVPLPRLDLRPRRQAGRGAEPDQDARHRPCRVRAAPHRGARVAGLRVGVPGRDATVVRRHGAQGRRRSTRRRRLDRPLRRRAACASVAGSATTSRRTGSSSSRTSWSATTAPPSTRN